MRDEDNRLHVEPSFLQKNAELYHADAYSAPFDESTLRDINNWISEKTDGQIENMLDEISYDTVMYLINAVLFDAEWQDIYQKNAVIRDSFTNSKGKSETVDFMYDDEGIGFKLDGAVALARPYAGGTYEFVAVLPDEGTTPEDYLKTLDAETLLDAMSGSRKSAFTAIPKFSLNTDTELSNILEGFGMKLAFGGEADLSALGYSDRGPLYISCVLHSAVIEVNERGTKAGAATIVEVNDESAMMTELHVTLDRPFIFFICDTATHTPIFCGIVNSVA